jgi:hypothetical protein
VYLRLIHDPGSNQSHLTLTTPVFEHDWQNQVVLGVANTAYSLLTEQRGRDQVERLAEYAMSAAARLGDNFIAQAGGAVACQSGCAHCCYQSVGVTPPEALRIYAYLKTSLSETEWDNLKRLLDERRAATRDLSSNERFSPEHPCPFLQEAACSIYPVRPLSCRGANSLDALDCERRLYDPEERERFLRDGSGSRMLLEPVRAMQALSAGLQLALSERFDLDMRPLDLILAMDLLLRRGQEVIDEWFKGEPAFASALGARSERQV